MKMYLLETVVMSYKHGVDSDKHSKMLDFFLINQRYVLLNLLYQNYFNLIKIHNCDDNRCNI